MKKKYDLKFVGRCVSYAIGALLFLVIPVSHEAADAATYYVSPVGSDTAIGSATAPFRTIQRAANVVNPGDTVIVKDGVYTDTDGDNYIVNTRRGGSLGKWVTFRSENKWGAKLDGKSNTTGYCWNIGTVGYVRVEDFDISGCRFGGFWSNMKAHDVYIYGNDIHDIGRSCVAVATGTYAIGQAGVYQGNAASYHTYDSNFIHDIGRLDCGYTLTDYNHDHGLYLKGHHNTIINNVFHNNRAGWGVSIVGSTTAGDGVGWLVSNNTFSGSNPGRSGHILISNSTLSIVPTDVTIQNNISYGEDSYMVNVLDNMSGTLKNVVIRNNLTSTGRILEPGSWGSVTQLNNLTAADPKFVNAADSDFHLQATSPAIDKGIDTGLDYDADGNAVVGAPDIGAFEHVGNTDTTDPSVPGGLTATAVSSSQINLSWSASTDNVGVAGYAVYRNGTRIDTITGRSYADSGLSPAVVYTYTVAAYDAQGNLSAQSASVSAKTLSATGSSTEIIVDNGTAGTSFTGTWGVSGGINPYGSNSLWSRDGATYTWQAKMPVSGTYKVYAWWTVATSRSTNVPVTVTYKGGSQTLSVNQQLNGGKWNYLGSFPFDALANGKVTLSAPGASPTSYGADAVRFVLDQAVAEAGR